MTHEMSKILESNMVPVYEEEEDHNEWKMDQKERDGVVILKCA